ncbi:Tautomerase/MIF [Xylariaceae sp. FL1272]|nr:Tautomerase/MIF [Xylariaceae sp. FL1272]
MPGTSRGQSVRAPNAGSAATRRPDSPAIIQREDPPMARSGPFIGQRHSHRLSAAALVEGNDIIRSIDRPLPGDVFGRDRPQLHPDLQRRRNTYYENEFAATNRSEDPSAVRIRDEAMVVAEFKTNLHLTDELGFVTHLAWYLSIRYKRPVSSISVTIQQGVCILFAGTFEPSCFLTISALPELVQPATNRRNASLLQQHIRDALNIVPSRTLIRFQVTPAENMSIGGYMVTTEAVESKDELERSSMDRKASLSRKPSKFLKSMRSLSNLSSFMSTSDLAGSEHMPPNSTSDDASRIGTIPEVPLAPTDADFDRHMNGDAKQYKKENNTARRRKSTLLFPLFGPKAGDGKRAT